MTAPAPQSQLADPSCSGCAGFTHHHTCGNPAKQPQAGVGIVQELRETAGNLINGVINDGSVSSAILCAAADRIEELTRALREISDLYVSAPGWAAPAPSHAREYKMHQIARSALSLEDRS